MELAVRRGLGWYEPDRSCLGLRCGARGGLRERNSAPLNRLVRKNRERDAEPAVSCCETRGGHQVRPFIKQFTGTWVESVVRLFSFFPFFRIFFRIRARPTRTAPRNYNPRSCRIAEGNCRIAEL